MRYFRSGPISYLPQYIPSWKKWKIECLSRIIGMDIFSEDVLCEKYFPPF